MNIKITSIEVQRTEDTKDSEPLYSAIANLASNCGPFQALFLFTRTGVFLEKHGRPFVRVHDYNQSCNRTIPEGQTNYQALLYNRMVERLGEVKTQVVAFLIHHEFIDPLSLRKRNPKLYRAAASIKELNFK